MGTELQKRGLNTDACPEAFNVTHPEIVQSIYKDYFDAGSDIVETNSFGGNREQLTMYGKESEVFRLNRKAAELARAVCPPGRFVAGSIGPTGAMPEPMGTLPLQKAYDYFKEQAEALAEGGVDLFYVETMMAVEEAEIAVKAAKESTGLPVVGSMTFDLAGDSVRTSWGVDVPTMVRRLSAAGADVLGANCGNGVEVVLRAMREMRPLTRLPLMAQPNAGLPEIKNSLIVYPETPESFEEKMKAVLAVGIGILGGCCGSGPEHIRHLRHLINHNKEGNHE
jgi:5-methyltetrahydrofolate--homocysteine methyltransferase